MDFTSLDEMSFMSDEQVAELFGDGEGSEENKGGSQEEPPKKPEDDPENGKKPAEEASEVDLENLFGGEDDPDNPESVGSEEDKQGKKEGAPSDKSVPPFSSLAKALKEEGILLDLEDSEIEKVQDAESFAELMERTIQAKFDERQKRIDEALNNGVEPSLIQQYENIITNLNSITDEQIEAESEQGENLRKQLLYRDYLNRGYKEERARREVERAVKDGTDIDDAKEALENIKETMQTQYQAKLDEARQQEAEVKKQQVEQAKQLRKSLLEDKEVFGDLEIDKATRQRALEAIVKPVYQDPETGRQYTAIQNYERENRVEFLKKIGLIYAMTDGFKSLDGLVKGKVKKEVGKGMKELEQVINGTQRKGDGSLDFAGGKNNPDSLGFTLDL